MCKGVYEQINDFCVNQPQLSLREEDQYYKLTGKYIYSLSYFKAIFEGAKEVELYIPKAFPKVPIKLKCKKYPEDFNHVYPNGNACLATIGEIQFFLSDSPTVEEFIEHFINPFFFTLEYFEEYHAFPFGERAHGTQGLLSFYKEKWNLDEEDLVEMFDIIFHNKYRGHHLCFCNSCKKLRDYHGKLVFKIISHSTLREKFIHEFLLIESCKKEVIEYCQRKKLHKMRNILLQKELK